MDEMYKFWLINYIEVIGGIVTNVNTLGLGKEGAEDPLGYQ